jgi:hypothetical protein
MIRPSPSNSNTAMTTEATIPDQRLDLDTGAAYGRELRVELGLNGRGSAAYTLRTVVPFGVFVEDAAQFVGVRLRPRREELTDHRLG